MQESPKTRRPKAETPKGFRDSFGAEVAERKAMLDRIAEVYHRHGFDALETSAVEMAKALGKFLPDVDRPNAGVFAWKEEAVPGGGSGDWLALRYDLTAPLARVAAQYRNDLPTPYRRYAMGPVWRNEKPGPGRFRQFYQCDADTVGSASPAADAEIIAMLAEALEAAGIARRDYLIRVNSRKVLDGVLQEMGHDPWFDYSPHGPRPGGPLHSAMKEQDDALFSRDDVLRTVDKFDKIGEKGVRELLTTGRKDQSGAFIEGLGLKDRQVDPLIKFLLSGRKDNAATLANLRAAVGASAIGAEGVGELEEIARLLAAMGLGPDRVVIDPSVVRGLGYYTGAVFEAELTFEVLDEKGRKRQFGSVAGGGRYDGLVERFTGQKVPATGVSIGVDRLLTALNYNRVFLEEGPIVVTVMDHNRMVDYFAMTTELQAKKIDDKHLRAEVYLGNSKNLGNQLKYADKRKSPIAVIQGENEAAKDVVLLKDLYLGEMLSSAMSRGDWKSHPAQIEVPRAQLAEAVKKMLLTIRERVRQLHDTDRA